MITEEQLYKVKDVGFHRLSPDGLSAFLLVSFIFSGFMTLIPFLGNRSNELQIPWVTAITTIFFILWITHGLIAIAFLSMKIAFRYQKWQILFVNILYIKLTFEGFVAYFVSVKGGHPLLLTLGVTFLLVGILYFLWSIQRAKVNLEKGEGSAEGKGLLYSGHCKMWARTPLILFGLLVITVILFMVNGIGNAWLLVMWVPVQLGLSYAYPEFYFLAYGKWSYPSFINQAAPDKKKGIKKR